MGEQAVVVSQKDPWLIALPEKVLSQDNPEDLAPVVNKSQAVLGFASATYPFLQSLLVIYSDLDLGYFWLLRLYLPKFHVNKKSAQSQLVRVG